MTKLNGPAKKYIIEARNQLPPISFQIISERIERNWHIQITRESVRAWFNRSFEAEMRNGIVEISSPGPKTILGTRRTRKNSTKKLSRVEAEKLQIFYELIDGHTSVCRNRGASIKVLQLLGRNIIDTILRDLE